MDMVSSFKAVEEKAKALLSMANAARIKAAAYDRITTAVVKGVRTGELTFSLMGSSAEAKIRLTPAETTKLLELIGAERGKELQIAYDEIQAFKETI